MGKWERWKPEDWTLARQLLQTNTIEFVAKQLGRSHMCVKEKLRWENMSEEKRQARRDHINAKRRAAAVLVIRVPQKRGPKPRGDIEATRIHFEAVGPKITAEQQADRDARYAISPRSLTAAFFKDPLPGYSALERKI